jgi:VWFA-related protein
MFKRYDFLLRMAILSVLLVALTGFTPTPPPAESDLVVRITQVDTTQFPQVRVYVSVTNPAGDPVAISPSQIELQENGEPVKPDEIHGSGDIGPLATMLVIDTSGSMNSGGKLEAAKAAARAYVDQSRPEDLIGILTFNTQIEYVQPLTKDRQKLLEAIDGLKALRDTAMYEALDQAMELIQPIEGRKAIIVMTDGLDNRSKISPLELIQKVGAQGLTISTIGLGDPTHSQGAITALDEAGLKALAREAGGEYGYANDAESLRNLYERYGRALQSEYVISYTSPSKLRDGVNRALSVSLASGSAVAPVKYNPGGLIPEVGKPASWMLFAGLVVGLLLLLIVPLALFRLFFARRSAGEQPPGGRIKLEAAGAAPKKPRSGGNKVKLKG